MFHRSSPTMQQRGRRARACRRSRLRPCRLHVEVLERRILPSAPSDLLVNTPITTNLDVQQMPSIAADPADPKHLVVAYMDYSLRTTGYAGIGVAVSENAAPLAVHLSATAGRLRPGSRQPRHVFRRSGARLRQFHGGDLPGTASGTDQPQHLQPRNSASVNAPWASRRTTACLWPGATTAA